MEFAVVLVATVALVLALSEIIKKYAVVFYCIAAILVVLFLAGANGLTSGSAWKLLVVPVQRCTVALSLFVVVMFIGALPKGGKLDLRLRPIRSELSIIGCILCLGHICRYLASYAGRAVVGSLALSTTVSFVVALFLFVLLGVLGITSFGFVKRRMRASMWKSIQRFSYVFFALIWVHILFMFAPSALNGGDQAVLSIAVYSVVFVAYLVARVARLFRDGAPKESSRCVETISAVDA